MRVGSISILRARPEAAGAVGTVYLVSCVSKKRLAPSRARDLYVSDWFKKARRYVEASGCAWFILSAEYGLVRPDEVITPYEKTLNAMSVGERRQWARKVIAQMEEAMPQVTRAVFLAGERYREFLTDHLKSCSITVEIPMQGLGIGKQLSWLDKNAP